MDLAQVFAFLSRCQSTGKRVALVTVCAVEGSSMRNPGTHMAVCEDGSFAGSLSGGCIEIAVVAEAQAAIEAGDSRQVRFGAGSPYLDIKLPCGGGLDLHFQPLTDTDIIEASCAAIRERRPFSIEIEQDGIHYVDEWEKQPFDQSTTSGTFGHWPAPKVLIIGHGAGVPALAGLSRNMHCDVEVLTPDFRVEEQLCAESIPVSRIAKTTDTHLLASDPWTAIVFLFHDHDWETDLLKRALEMPSFYVGAMGGRKAHAMRQGALSQLGVSDAEIATIHAPIGLFHSSRDPQTLALSTLGEIMSAYHNADFEALSGK